MQTFQYETNAHCEAKYVEGKQEGIGVDIYKDNRYEGNYENGKRHGRGIY